MKIEQVTEYVARDGRRFRDEASCVTYEHELDLVEPILHRLPRNNVPPHQYVQHHPPTLRAIKRELFALVVARYGDSNPGLKQWDADQVHPCSGVGRAMSDASGPIAEAWRKLARFNFELGR